MTIGESDFEAAVEAYRAGEHRTAAILFCQAAQQAHEYGNEMLCFRTTVWSAEALYEAGDLKAALDALIVARMNEPSGAEFEHWLSRKLQFKINLVWEPRAAELYALLDELGSYSQRGQFPPQDLPTIRGELAAARGAWNDALREYERSLASLSPGASGATKHGIAHAAARSAISSRQFGAARDWIDAIRDEEEWKGGFERTILAYQKGAQLTLARASRVSQAGLERLLREYDDICRGMDEGLILSHLRGERARVALLSVASGDPRRRGHAARTACRDVLPDERLNKHFRFDHFLLLLDYRLACVRFCLAQDPVDDEFCEEFSPPARRIESFDAGELSALLRRAAATLARAKAMAAHLDGLLDCDWRQREIDKRASRLAGMVRF